MWINIVYHQVKDGIDCPDGICAYTLCFGDPIKPWKGWLEAVADLLPDRPFYTWDSGKSDWVFHQTKGDRETNGLAKWQMNRLEEAIALGKLKEFNSLIVDGKNAGREITFCDEQKPAYTIVGSCNSESHWPTAILVPGANANSGRLPYGSFVWRSDKAESANISQSSTSIRARKLYIRKILDENVG